MPHARAYRSQVDLASRDGGRRRRRHLRVQERPLVHRQHQLPGSQVHRSVYIGDPFQKNPDQPIRAITL
jgi:hypothetical protein